MSANDMFNKDANPAGDDANSSGSEDDEELEENFQIVKCDLCGKNFDSAMAIAVHKTLAHPDALPAAVDERKHKCSFCEKRFASQGALRNHEDSHILPDRFKCETCGKGFNQKGNLRAHELRHKPADGLTPRVRFPCQFCMKDFASKGARVNHERMHTDNERFKCQFCGKGFNQKANMESHQRVHTAERPYKCDLCDKAFASRPGLYAHKKSGHKVNPNKRKKGGKSEREEPGGNQDWDPSLVQSTTAAASVAPGNPLTNPAPSDPVMVKQEVAPSPQPHPDLAYTQHLQQMQSLRQHFNPNF